MRNKVINILKATEGISDWRVLSTKTESTELFFVHKNLETVRSTDTSDVKVTVYVAHSDKLGEATFSVYSSYGDEKITEEIEKAKKRRLLLQISRILCPKMKWENILPPQILQIMSHTSLLHLFQRLVLRRTILRADQ
jgi:predicted Zn-dependent protease